MMFAVRGCYWLLFVDCSVSLSVADCRWLLDVRCPLRALCVMYHLLFVFVARNCLLCEIYCSLVVDVCRMVFAVRCVAAVCCVSCVACCLLRVDR